MKQIVTIISCILFVAAGALTIGFTNDRASPSLFPGNGTMYAGQLPNTKILSNDLPLDIQLDLNKRAKKDTVYIDTGRVDTVYKYKTKIRKVVVPNEVEHDTLCVPVFYIATPLEHEVKSTEIRVIDDVHIDSLLQTNQTDLISND